MKKRYVKYCIFFLIIILCVIGAVILGNVKISDDVMSSLSYVENNKTSYKVYYDNPYYDADDYLEENKTYIRDNVSKVDIDYDYILNFSDYVTGNYTTTVKRELKVYEPGNESNDYWTKTYDDITDSSKYNHQKTVEVTNNTVINYQDYVNDYNDYKSSNLVSSDAKLTVTYIIKYEGKYDGLDSINDTKKITLEIPISDVTFTIDKSDNLNSDMQTFTTKEDNSNKRVACRIISVSLWLFTIIMSIVFIAIYSHDAKKESTYSRKLRHILNTYDSIIVNVDKLAPLEDVAIAKVSSFEELLDAQNEVRLPINYKEDKKRHMAKFILLRNNFAWVYVLKEGEDDEK